MGSLWALVAPAPRWREVRGTITSLRGRPARTAHAAATWTTCACTSYTRRGTTSLDRDPRAGGHRKERSHGDLDVHRGLYGGHTEWHRSCSLSSRSLSVSLPEARNLRALSWALLCTRGEAPRPAAALRAIRLPLTTPSVTTQKMPPLNVISTSMIANLHTVEVGVEREVRAAARLERVDARRHTEEAQRRGLAAGRPHPSATTRISSAASHAASILLPQGAELVPAARKLARRRARSSSCATQAAYTAAREQA